MPSPPAHLAGAGRRGRLTLTVPVSFGERGRAWLDRVASDRAVRYDLWFDPGKDRWYVDASWKTPAVPQPGLAEPAGLPRLGVDLNAGHLAAWVLDPSGNPSGPPHTIGLDLAGQPASVRDGRLRQAITEVITIAGHHGCVAIVIEDLNFADARATGREQMGRGRRGARFRRTVAGIPTGQLRDRPAGMAHHAGLVVIAVDPAYTSAWGGRHRRGPLQERFPDHPVSRHHAAAVVIGRRSQGLSARRRPGVTVPDRKPRAGGIAGRRATNRNAGTEGTVVQDAGRAARRPGTATTAGGRVRPAPPSRPPVPASRPAGTVRDGPTARTSAADHQRPSTDEH